MNRSFLELIKSRLHSWSCVTVQGLAKRPYNDTYTCFQSKVHSQPASTATWWRKIYLHDYRDVYTYTSARIHVLDKRNTSCHLSDYSEITVARRGIVVVYISEERWKESHVVREKRLQGDAGSSNVEKLAPNFSIASASFKKLRLKVFRGWTDGSFCSAWPGEKKSNSQLFEMKGKQWPRIEFIFSKNIVDLKSLRFSNIFSVHASLYISFALPISIDSFICFSIPCQLIRKFSLAFPDLYLSSFFCDIIIHVVS